MSARSRKQLLPPTMAKRAAAAQAAQALHDLAAGRIMAGAQSVMHLDYSRPRRGERITTWENLPGFRIVNGAYQHTCLPGWQYTKAEVRSEMIPDLEALAERGVRPTKATVAA